MFSSSQHSPIAILGNSKRRREPSNLTSSSSHPGLLLQHLLPLLPPLPIPSINLPAQNLHTPRLQQNHPPRHLKIPQNEFRPNRHANIHTLHVPHLQPINFRPLRILQKQLMRPRRPTSTSSTSGSTGSTALSIFSRQNPNNLPPLRRLAALLRFQGFDLTPSAPSYILNIQNLNRDRSRQTLGFY